MKLDKDVEHPIWVDRGLDEVMWRRVDSDDVHAWFERCLDDFPNLVGFKYNDYLIIEWKEKWFSQFDSLSQTIIKEDK
jgi:hypothetical protein